MSKKENISILYKNQNKIYHLLEIIIMDKDSSIYFTFPNNKNQKIIHQNISDYENKYYCQNTKQFETPDIYLNDPKISFHPRDMICHVKDPNNIKINDSYKLLVNIIDNIEYIYLTQILFPNNLNNLYEYTEPIKDNSLVIEKLDLTKATLNLEIMIHSNNFIPNESMLPIANNRLFRTCRTYRSNSNYSYTIFISTISKRHISLNNSIIFTLNTLDKAIIYEIGIENNQ